MIGVYSVACLYIGAHFTLAHDKAHFALSRVGAGLRREAFERQRAGSRAGWRREAVIGAESKFPASARAVIFG